MALRSGATNRSSGELRSPWRPEGRRYDLSRAPRRDPLGAAVDATRRMSGRILVIGGQGVLGTFIASALAEAGHRVLRGGRRRESDPSLRLLDLDRPETVGPACGEVDLVVNTVPHPGLAPERAVLGQGGTLLNIASMSAAERAHLNAEADAARGLVVVHAGLAPGVVNLVAAEMLAAYPDADSVEIALTLSASGSAGKAGGGFGYRIFTGSAHHRTIDIPFPAPVGRRACLEVSLEEEGWLGGASRVRQQHLYVTLLDRLPDFGMRFANALRIISLLPRAAFFAGRGGVPAELSREAICEWVAVGREGRRMTVRTVEGYGDYRMTTAATVVFAEALLRRREADLANRNGVCGVEDLFSLRELQPALEAGGLRITERPDLVRP